MKAAEWIDEAKKTHGIESDYRIAKVLNIRASAVSNYRNRAGATLDDEIAVRVAELIGIDPVRVIADQHAERARTDRMRTIWRQIAAAAAVILTVGNPALFPSKSYSYGITPTSDSLYIMRTRRRRHGFCHTARFGRQGFDAHAQGTHHPRRTHERHRRQVSGHIPAHAAQVHRTRHRAACVR